MKQTKRLATTEEIEAAESKQVAWLKKNGYDCPEGYEQHVREKRLQAEQEGYKNEVCSCGAVFLAFHHFTLCKIKDCPFRDNQGSLLDRMTAHWEDQDQVMISKVVEVDFTIEDVLSEIKHFKVLELVWAFNQIAETLSDEMLMELWDFVGEETVVDWIAKVSAFNQRMQKIVEIKKPD